MSKDSKNGKTDLDDLLAAYNIKVTEGSGSGSPDNFLEPPAAKRSKRKNYVPHKPRHFFGGDGDAGEDVEASGDSATPTQNDRAHTPNSTSSRGSSRDPTPTPPALGNQQEGPETISSSQPKTQTIRPHIEPSEIYVAPNQPALSVSNIRSMAPSAATQLLNQQRKMAAAKVAQQKKTTPGAVVGAPIMLIPVSSSSVPAAVPGSLAGVDMSKVTSSGISLVPTSLQGAINVGRSIAARPNGGPRISIVENPNATKMMAGKGGSLPVSGLKNVPQSVRSDQFIASQILKNQASLQKTSLQAVSAAAAAVAATKNPGISDERQRGAKQILTSPASTALTGFVPGSDAPVVNLVANSSGAVFAVSPGAVTSLIPVGDPKTMQPTFTSTVPVPIPVPVLPQNPTMKTLPRDVVKKILTKKYVAAYKPQEIPSLSVKGKMASGELPGGAGPFSCADCGDIFWMKSSYESHRSRRSMKLTLNCKWCQSSFIFYNKCLLLEHAREHSSKRQPLDLAKVVISPIPREMVSAGLDTSDNEIAVKVGGATIQSTEKSEQIEKSPSATNQAPRLATSQIVTYPSAGGVDQPIQILTPKTMVTVQNALKLPEGFNQATSVAQTLTASTLPKGGLLKCPECGIGAQSIAALQVHFGEREKSVNKACQCYCGYNTPSPCALSAHKRIHTETIPFVCPECGALFNDKATFSAHLQLMCLHYSRCPGYQCPKCGEAVIYSKLELVRSHVMTSHGETYYKCQACPMAFKSMTSFDGHRTQNHQGARVAYKTIYKCPLCDTVFHQMGQQQQHMDTHMKDVALNARYAFKCSECKQFFDTKTQLLEHVKNSHFKEMTSKICNLCFQPFATEIDLQRHLGPDGSCPDFLSSRSQKSKEGKGGAVAKAKEPIKNEDEAEGDTLLEPGKLSSTPPEDVVETLPNTSVEALSGSPAKSPASGTMPAIRDLEEDIPEGVVRVIPMPPKEVNSVDKSVDGNRTNFAEVSNWLFQENYKLMCKVCFEQYHSITELTAHGRRHVQDGLNVCTHRYCQNLQFATREALQAHVRSGHRTDLPEAQPMIDLDHVPVKESAPGEGAVSAQQEDEANKGAGRRSSEGFSCAKCDYATPDQAEFMIHIVCHKSDRDSIQCAECGSCFTAEPSLRRHLFVSHKIRDFQLYLSRISEVSRTLDRKSTLRRDDASSRRSSPSSSSVASEGGPRECTVCYKPFETEAALKTHMRTHGMAFIRSKRFSSEN